MDQHRSLQQREDQARRHSRQNRLQEEPGEADPTLPQGRAREAAQLLEGLRQYNTTLILLFSFTEIKLIEGEVNPIFELTFLVQMCFSKDWEILRYRIRMMSYIDHTWNF